jgi:predicted TIM-barrel fold metal-dependent hydrolase
MQAATLAASQTALRIDSHAHVFTRRLPVVAGARHRPDYDALPEKYQALLDAHGITHALLTAPSFLGTDNSYLLAALARSAGRWRGTVIVDPDIEHGRLDEMQRAGVVGIRLNWFRRTAIPDVRSGDYQRLFRHLAERDWHVEMYVEGPHLAQLLPSITATGVKVVVDHFGSPDPEAGVRCAGFRAVLSAVAAGRTWIKLSAPYRLGGADAGVYADVLLRECGPERLLWGSDWPWTQNAAGKRYVLTLEWLERWVPDAQHRKVILGATPAALFGFTASAAAGATI